MDTSKTVRGIAGSGAIAAVIAAIAQFQSWEDFLVWALTSGGAAALVWAIIEAWDTAAARAHKTVNPDLKMYGAQALAVLIPVAGNLIAWRTGLITLDYLHIVGMVTVCYYVSQTIHWEASSSPHEEAHPNDGEPASPTPKPMTTKTTKDIGMHSERHNAARGTYAVAVVTLGLLLASVLALASCGLEPTVTPVSAKPKATKVVTAVVTKIVTVAPVSTAPGPVITMEPEPTSLVVTPMPINTPPPTVCNLCPLPTTTSTMGVEPRLSPIPTVVSTIPVPVPTQ